MAARLLGIRLVALVGSSFGDPYQRGGPTEIYHLAQSEQLDALVVASGAIGNFQGPASIHALLARLPKRPTVSIGMHIDGCSSVVSDGGGIDVLVEHLVGVHRVQRIAFLNGPPANPDSTERERQFTSALDNCGIPRSMAWYLRGDFTPVSGRSAVASLLDTGARPQAIMCANDAMAIGVREELLQRRLRIPDDVVLTGYDDIEEARTMIPSLTSVNASTFRMSFRAVERAVEMIDGGEIMQEMLTTSVVLRRSCGCRLGSSNYMLPRLMVEASGAPQPQRLREILADKEAAGRFLADLENTFDTCEPAELDHWEQVFLAASQPPPPPECSQTIMEAHAMISRARHGLDERRRQALQHLMRDEHLAMQALLQDLRLETLPERLLETLGVFSESHLRLLLFHKDFSPRSTPDYGSREFELEIDTCTGYIGPPESRNLLPEHGSDSGRWITLTISLGSEHYGILQLREWVSNEILLESFRLSLWMVFSAARKDHRERLAMAELHRQSIRDELTGLFNRRGLLEQGELLVRNAMRTRSRIGVVLCDLDGLKEINDRFGHPDGDLALRTLARALEDGFRQSDVVGRLGGDEFAVLTTLGAEGSLQGAITRVREALAKRSEETGRTWRAHTSAGWMAWEPWDGSSLESALAKADAVLYLDKRARKENSDHSASGSES